MVALYEDRWEFTLCMKDNGRIILASYYQTHSYPHRRASDFLRPLVRKRFSFFKWTAIIDCEFRNNAGNFRMTSQDRVEHRDGCAKTTSPASLELHPPTIRGPASCSEFYPTFNAHFLGSRLPELCQRYTTQ